MRTNLIAVGRAVKLHHLLAFLWALMAVSIAKTPPGGLFDPAVPNSYAGAIGWFRAVCHIPPYWLAFLFVVAGIQLASNPKPKAFITCFFPLMLYTALSFVYITATGAFGLSSTVNLFSILLICLILRFHKFGNLEIRGAYAFSMAALAAAFLEYPDRGVVGWMANGWSVSGDVLAVLMLIGALLIVAVQVKNVRRQGDLFMFFGLSYPLYQLSVLIYVSLISNVGGYTSSVSALIGIVVVFYTGLNIQRYLGDEPK